MRIFPEIDSKYFYSGSFPENWDLRLSYLGTAGFVFEADGHVIVVDPYVSRPSLWKTLTQRLIPDLARIQSYIPKADDVLIGHAHHDHILDAPDLCKQTGARFIGSRSACLVARAAGVPESQIVETKGRERIACGPHHVTALPSLHGKVFMGKVLLPGNIKRQPDWPMRTHHFRHGQVLNWHLEMADTHIVHIDSADFIEQEIKNSNKDSRMLELKNWLDYLKTAA